MPSPDSAAGDPGDRRRILRVALSSPRRYVQTWYFAYLLFGVVTAGLAPILLPLLVAAKSSRPMMVGLVMGVWDLGLLSSPLWGVAAGRYRLYRPLFFVSFVVIGCSCAAMPLLHGALGWMITALAFGVGTGGAATLASLFIVDFVPKAEWEPRIGMLQGFNGVGQVLGLILAAVFCRISLSFGLWFAAALFVPALLLGRLDLPIERVPGRNRFTRRFLHRMIDVQALAAFPRVNTLTGVGFHLSQLHLSGLRLLPGATRGAFGRFLGSSFVFSFGVAGFFTYLPLMFATGYGIDPDISASLYALGAAVGVLFFIFAGYWSTRYGAARIYRAALWARVAGFALLLAPGLILKDHDALFGATGLVLIVLAWPVISVSATSLAAHLAPFSEGAAMGLFNATASVATMLGALAGAPLVHVGGYRAISIVAILSLLAAIYVGRDIESVACDESIPMKQRR